MFGIPINIATFLRGKRRKKERSSLLTCPYMYCLVAPQTPQLVLPTGQNPRPSQHDGGVGPKDIMDDISPDQLKDMTDLYCRANVVVSVDEARAIEIQTVTQSSSDLWREERRKRLTASNCGKIAKMTQKTMANKVKELLYSTFKGNKNKATERGKMQECNTREAHVRYQHQHSHEGLTTSPTGLVIHPDHPWMACSPDDQVFDPSETDPHGLVEYKNPYSVRNMTLFEACEKKRALSS